MFSIRTPWSYVKYIFMCTECTLLKYPTSEYIPWLINTKLTHYNFKWYEPRHDKTNNVAVCPAKTQISLFACAQWVAKDPSFLHTDSEDSDQTERMPRLIWARLAHSHFVDFVMSRLILNGQFLFRIICTKLIVRHHSYRFEIGHVESRWSKVHHLITHW